MVKKFYIIASCKEWHRHCFVSLEKDISVDWVWVSSPEELLGALQQEKPRYIFFLHWNWLVPEKIWKSNECVCFHMTDVPYGRGGSPLQNLIVRGHTETTLTALRMVQEMDAGPVYAKRRFSLEGTAHEIYLRAGELSFDLIRWMIKNEPQPEPQKGESVIFKRRTPEQSLLPVFGSVKNLYNHIRMLDAPTYPKAYLEHGEFILEFSGANTCEGELTATVRIRKKIKAGDNMNISIDGVTIGPEHPPYIIAELSANHNGSLDRAFETIKEAKRRGASAIKLQTYTADTMTIDSDRPEFLIKGGPWDGYKLYDLYRWAQTPFEWHKAMFDYAHELGITVFSTPFDESAVDLLEELNAPAYKIASFELTDLPLVEYVAKTGKPMIMSTGMATENEIGEAVTAARNAGCKELVLLHCISSYPAPMEQANVAQLVELGRRFNAVPGLSDHTLGTTASVAAVSLGACLIEKHFILNRNDGGPDSGFSIEPQELERLCTDTRDAWAAVGKPSYNRQEAEQANKIFRRSIYFMRDMKAGEVVEDKDIRRIRPGIGLEPKHFNTLVGKTLKIDVNRGTPTSWELFDE